MKKRIRHSLYLAGLCASIVCASLLAGCGEDSDQNMTAESVSDTSQKTSSSLSVEDSSLISSSVTEINGDYASQTFGELTFDVKKEWVESSNFQTDTENTHTMTLDYYPSSDASIEFTYYDYKDNEEASGFTMQGIIPSLVSYMQSSDGISAVNGLQLLPTNKNICVTTLEGTYDSEDEQGPYFLNIIYYFIPGETGIYQIGLSVNNTVDPAEYQEEFKKLYQSIVLNGEVVEESTTPKYLTFFKAALEGMTSDYQLELSDNGDGSFGLVLNGEAQDSSITFTDKQILLHCGNMSDDNSMISMQIALAEVIYITSPEIGMSDKAYEQTNSMLDEFQQNAHYDQQYDITLQKNVYHFLASESSVDITVDIR